MSLLRSALDLVLPRTCIVCGRHLMPSEEHICIPCLADMPLTRFERLSRNPMADRFNEKISAQGDVENRYCYASALYYYRGDSGYRKISVQLKYYRNFGAGKYFARMLGGALASSDLFADVDLVVPVPLHWTRRRSRGYNQAEVIGREVASRLGCPLGKKVLKRNRRTKTQTRLRGAQKAANVFRAFSVLRLPETQPNHILLVDDVFTTGATLVECYRALRTVYGPEVRISVATLGFVGR